jgi:hypothetical protein
MTTKGGTLPRSGKPGDAERVIENKFRNCWKLCLQIGAKSSQQVHNQTYRLSVRFLEDGTGSTIPEAARSMELNKRPHGGSFTWLL